MAGYLVLPISTELVPSYANIISYGTPIFYAPTWTRYAICPKLYDIENNLYQTNCIVKFNFYRENATDCWCVFGTYVTNSTYWSCFYYADSDVDVIHRIQFSRVANSIQIFKPFSINITTRELPPGASVYSTEQECIDAMDDGNWEYVPPVIDPYGGGGISEPSDTEGTFDFTSDEIQAPSRPSIDVTDIGFLTAYNPTIPQLAGLAHYMWAGAFDVDAFKRIMANPMDAIIGLHIIPTVAGYPVTTESTLNVGNISTGLGMPKITDQYFQVDCGTITLDGVWGAYLDYSPYTKLSLYLPYIGQVSINADDCMNGSINVKYTVDVLSGSCVAHIYCTSNHGEDGHVLYSFSGMCACDIPVTSGQYATALQGTLGVIGGVAGGIMTGMAGNVAGGIMGGIKDAGNAIMSMIKPEISRSGDIGGSSGLMGIQYPYLILTIPKLCTPADQNKYKGYPSFVTMLMDDLEGYTEIDVTHLNNMSCTDKESSEIIELLKNGVIF